YLFGKMVNAFRSSSDPTQAMESKWGQAHAVVEVNIDKKVIEHIDRIRDRYRRVLRWHNPKLYYGQVTILVNEKYYARDRTLGWAKLALKGLEIHKLPGNHDTYIREHVKDTAQELKLCLDALNRDSPDESKPASMFAFSRPSCKTDAEVLTATSTSGNPSS